MSGFIRYESANILVELALKDDEEVGMTEKREQRWPRRRIRRTFARVAAGRVRVMRMERAREIGMCQTED